MEKRLEEEIKVHISRLNRLPINTGEVTEEYLLEFFQKNFKRDRIPGQNSIRSDIFANVMKKNQVFGRKIGENASL